MSEVVGWVDAPVVSGVVMSHLTDAIHNGITQQQNFVAHVDFGSQHMLAFIKFASLHAAEQV